MYITYCTVIRKPVPGFIYVRRESVVYPVITGVCSVVPRTPSSALQVHTLRTEHSADKACSGQRDRPPACTATEPWRQADRKSRALAPRRLRSNHNTLRLPAPLRSAYHTLRDPGKGRRPRPHLASASLSGEVGVSPPPQIATSCFFSSSSSHFPCSVRGIPSAQQAPARSLSPSAWPSPPPSPRRRSRRTRRSRTTSEHALRSASVSVRQHEKPPRHRPNHDAPPRGAVLIGERPPIAGRRTCPKSLLASSLDTTCRVTPATSQHPPCRPTGCRPCK